MRQFPQSPMTSPRYRFGIFEFDARTRELRRDGKIIRLQLQPAQVLSCLLDHAGDTVSRDDLRAAVWGAETFVDFDRGLNFCVAHLRSALDDDTVSPRFIRTFPRRGYQFIAPVQRLDASTSESPGTARQPKPAAVNLANPTQPTRKFSATTLALACAATAILVLFPRLRLHARRPARLQTTSHHRRRSLRQRKPSPILSPWRHSPTPSPTAWSSNSPRVVSAGTKSSETPTSFVSREISATWPQSPHRFTPGTSSLARFSPQVPRRAFSPTSSASPNKHTCGLSASTARLPILSPSNPK